MTDTDTNTEIPTPAPERLARELERLTDRLETLEAELDRKDERIQYLESTLEETETQLERTDERLERRVSDLEQAQQPIEARLDAHERKLSANKERVNELQARELEKGAHLLEENVDETEVDVADGRLERISKDDGRSYFRLPESDDPLDRGGSVSLAHGDLLPIQQLARMDEEMLRSTTSALPSRLAAKLWKARVDPSVGDDPWKSGCKGIQSYVDAGEMKHWIRRQEQGISDEYAKKLVSRTIDALLDLSKHRLAIRKRTQRKNGLEYTERRVVLMADTEIPGESMAVASPPETADVDG
ncbi:hypothetical protein [Natrarchaeobaculum sulfurireducens]|uniref:Uncharacterized protein n=1 Tax=Natrarchaeobaculum sulfurireducens TaxID=2044521 RepID=A0A346PK48_9EURY|nr:hypothetical protein [Natrarchaeobaculum sulfurireducens]AXR79893.1 hypothetical protein AArcMg_4068 [Natrarchaeobaculum sulfurireducens]